MNKQDKQELARELNEQFSTKSCALVLSHKKLTYEQIDKARRMSEKGTTLIKIKNRIAQKALSGSIYEEMTKNLKFENLFIFGDDLFEASKIAKALEKEVSDVVVLKAASTENNNYELGFINELASLGSKENLQSKVLNVISEVVKKALRVVSARCEMLEKGN